LEGNSWWKTDNYLLSSSQHKSTNGYFKVILGLPSSSKDKPPLSKKGERLIPKTECLRAAFGGGAASVSEMDM
jgi:hypothetical protein